MRAEWKCKASYTEQINTHVLSGCCVHSTFAYGDVPDPLKMYHGKGWDENFVQHIEYEVKLLYKIFPQQPMTQPTDLLIEKGAKEKEKFRICV